MASAPFFTVHRDLPREGQGSRAKRDAALAQIRMPKAARLWDASGALGADIDGQLDHADAEMALRLKYQRQFDHAQSAAVRQT